MSCDTAISTPAPHFCLLVYHKMWEKCVFPSGRNIKRIIATRNKLPSATRICIVRPHNAQEFNVSDSFVCKIVSIYKVDSLHCTLKEKCDWTTKEEIYYKNNLFITSCLDFFFNFTFCTIISDVSIKHYVLCIYSSLNSI